jgi:23S rRNA (uracil1939-C5)-methyltransferase
MRKRPYRPKPKEAVLAVETVGARGDGIAHLDGQPVYLPLTLAGDRVRARVEGERGDVVEFLDMAPRRDPPCPHFGVCGGCALQHMPDADYAAFAAERIAEAMARKGFNALPMADAALSPPGSRRRLTLAYERRRQSLALGYHARRSQRVADIGSCRVALPGLEALIAPLKALLGSIGATAGKVVLTASDTGVDALVTGLADPPLETSERLTQFARAHDLARLSIACEEDPGIGAPETVVQSRAPLLTLGGAPVPLAPAGFLQATRQGEAALVRAVTDWTTGPRVADLFAGCGTFSLPLMAGHRVTAVEGDAALLASLARAAGGRVETVERDLFLNPLIGPELAFDTVIMDPPRAGAMAQAQALAASGVPTVIAISCNPATFARDARILVDGGYDLTDIRPVDQFLWSAHVELAALFKRG